MQLQTRVDTQLYDIHISSDCSQHHDTFLLANTSHTTTDYYTCALITLSEITSNNTWTIYTKDTAQCTITIYHILEFTVWSYFLKNSQH